MIGEKVLKKFIFLIIIFFIFMCLNTKLEINALSMNINQEHRQLVIDETKRIFGDIRI